jgi:hypothetical protein
MKANRDLRSAAIVLMATVAAVGVIRGLVPRSVDATTPPAPASAVLAHPQTSSGEKPDSDGTLHLNTRGGPAAMPAAEHEPWPNDRPGA